MRCKIQWIDDNGKPTPDENEAIGIAYIKEHESESIRKLGGNPHVDESDHYPICVLHAARLADPGMDEWVFVPFQS